MKEVILTPEGFEKLKDEIQYLSNDRRREVAERIRVAREFGDIAENKLSNESPVGKAIMGRKKGETVEVAAPRGKLKFKIMDIKAA